MNVVPFFIIAYKIQYKGTTYTSNCGTFLLKI